MPGLALVEKVADDDKDRGLEGVDKGDPLGVLRDHPGGATALEHTQRESNLIHEPYDTRLLHLLLPDHHRRVNLGFEVAGSVVNLVTDLPLCGAHMMAELVLGLGQVGTEIVIHLVGEDGQVCQFLFEVLGDERVETEG